MKKPMKPILTKAQIRAQLEQAMSEFHNNGGEVKDVPRGLSGINDNVNIFAQGFSRTNQQARTPVNEQVQSLEERKVPPKPKNRRPKRVLIKDDFGEPLRWVWED